MVWVLDAVAVSGLRIPVLPHGRAVTGGSKITRGNSGVGLRDLHMERDFFGVFGCSAREGRLFCCDVGGIRAVSGWKRGTL